MRNTRKDISILIWWPAGSVHQTYGLHYSRAYFLYLFIISLINRYVY